MPSPSNTQTHNTSHPSPQPIVPTRARLGEGPCWHAATQMLYWVDIYNHRVHQFDPATKHTRYFEIDDMVSCAVPAGLYQLIIAKRHSLAFLDTRDGSVTPILTIEAEARHPRNRLNDGKCDSAGRFWIGAMHPENPVCGLYRYDPDGSLHQMESGLTISNGLGWSPDEHTFYLTDTPQQRIYAYDFDLQSGSIRNRRVFIDLSNESFFPDGITIDRNGCIWSAMWDGWCVIQFDPDGQEMQRVPMPVQCPTSCTFGGAELNMLYITSASVGLSQAAIEKNFYAGDLFCLPTDSVGLPSHTFGYK
ncbi:MAG: SMP-30/gluconolactonase/LRE family protein [Leptolyngbyaceae cyanobacterium HOT.MB2.61]|nr:SMP-30/gluconolactonase/LRE family protein [Leptolyngbyaceae cyanobacterium HOT.MB2.61]